MQYIAESVSSESSLEIQGKPTVTFVAVGTRKCKSFADLWQHAIDSRKLDVPSPGAVESERDGVNCAPTQVTAFSEADGSSSLSPGASIHDLTQPRASRIWYTLFVHNSGDSGGYNRTNRLVEISADKLSHMKITKSWRAVTANLPAQTVRLSTNYLDANSLPLLSTHPLLARTRLLVYIYLQIVLSPRPVTAIASHFASFKYPTIISVDLVACTFGR